MISLFVTLIVFLMLGMVVFQTLYVLGYQQFLSSDLEVEQPQPQQGPDIPADQDSEEDGSRPYAPAAAIILCLKDADESLVDCLTGIICQDYPDFELHIVIHSQADPAVNIVEDYFATLKFKPKIQFLESSLDTCSLKCSAIAQAVRALDDRIAVVAFIDDDAVVDDKWLSDLVAPLEDAGIGATTGNRWYSPTDARLGSLVRKIWNAAAVVQMQRYDIAWGGSLAMRRDVIERCQLLSTWQKSFCEDTSLTNVLREQKLRLHRVAHLIVENKEDASFWETFHWISRQLLTVRLHHPAWPLVLLHGIVTGLASIVAPLLMVLLFLSGMASEAGSLLKAILVYQIANFVLLLLVGRSNRQAMSKRDSRDQMEPLAQQRNLAPHILATIVTQIVQPFALWQANSSEKVKWRGATYRVKDGRNVRLLRGGKQKKSAAQKAATSEVVSLESEDGYISSNHFSKPSRN